MKKLSILLAASVALVALGGTADAKKRHKAVPQQQYEESWNQGWGWGHDNSWNNSWGYSHRGNPYAGRRDPSTWSGPMNAWDKARRDDALLADHR